MGRTAKPKLSLEEQEDEVILKYMYGEPMTLEESAMAIHMYDKAHTNGYKRTEPMTRMGYLKLETRILEKLRKACEDRGLNKDDMLELFSHGRRQCAAGNYGQSIDGD